MIGARSHMAVALGPQGLVAHLPELPRVGRFGVCQIVPDPTLAWLPDALTGVREALAVDAGATADFLILRPLALGKVLDLPPARGGALRALAEASIEQFFPVAAGDWTADAQRLERTRRRPRSTLVTALPAGLLDVIGEVCEGVGLRVGRVVAAPAAAALHARRLADLGHIPRTCRLELHLPDYVEAVRMEHARPTALIPLPKSGGGGIRPMLDAAQPACSGVVREWELALDLADVAVAATRIPQPRTTAQQRAFRRRARRRSGLLAVAASLVLIAGLGFDVVDQRRELSSLQRVRREIAADVEQHLQQRRTIDVAAQGLGELASAEQRRTDWPGIFRDLAVTLPEPIYFTQVGGRPDSLFLTVSTDDTGALDEILRDSPFDIVSAEAGGRGVVRLTVSWAGEDAGETHAD